MVWLLAVVYFLVKPTRYLLLYWSPVFVNDLLGTSTATSGFLGSMFDLAGPLGTLVGGFISDRLFKSKRIPICVIALFCLAICMAAFRFVPPRRLEIGIGMFVIGFLVYIPDSLVAGTASIDFGTKEKRFDTPAGWSTAWDHRPNHRRYVTRLGRPGYRPGAQYLECNFPLAWDRIGRSRIVATPTMEQAASNIQAGQLIPQMVGTATKAA